MPGNEIKMKTSLYAKKGQFWSEIFKKTKSYTCAILALTPSNVITRQKMNTKQINSDENPLTL